MQAPGLNRVTALLIGGAARLVTLGTVDQEDGISQRS